MSIKSINFERENLIFNHEAKIRKNKHNTFFYENLISSFKDLNYIIPKPKKFYSTYNL